MDKAIDDAIFDAVIDMDDGFTDSNNSDDEASETSEKTTEKETVQTTTKQFRKLYSYMETHEDFSKGKANAAQEREWDNFIVELNGMGPPHHTSGKWRVIWTNHKSNRRRKVKRSLKYSPLKVSSTLRTIDAFTNENTIDFDTQTVSGYGLVQDCKTVKMPYVDEDKENFHAKVLNKLDTLIELQERTNQNVTDLIDVLKNKLDIH